MARDLQPPRASPQRGFSLFEILITVVIISIGLLGLAGLQFIGLRAANNAQEYTYAGLLAQDIEERIRANPGSDYHSISITPSSVDCINNSCTPAQMRSFDGSQWYYMLHSGGDNTPILANATVSVAGTGTNYTVTITWGDPSGPQSLTSTFSST